MAGEGLVEPIEVRGFQMVMGRVKAILIITIALFIVLSSHAGGELSGGNILQIKSYFKSFSPGEAYLSKEFDKRVPNIYMPGTSTWYNASNSLCLDGNTLQTVHPDEDCYEWKVELQTSEYGKKYATFTNLSMARRKADGKNGRGKPICIGADYDYIVVPLQRTEIDCLRWRVDKVTGAPRIFEGNNKKRAAERYAEESRRAKGKAYCLDEDMGPVTRTVSSSYKVTFYAKPKSSKDKYDSSLKIGEHTFRFSNCDRFADRDPKNLIVPTGGELSGGNSKSKNK